MSHHNSVQKPLVVQRSYPPIHLHYGDTFLFVHTPSPIINVKTCNETLQSLCRFIYIRPDHLLWSDFRFFRPDFSIQSLSSLVTITSTLSLPHYPNGYCSHLPHYTKFSKIIYIKKKNPRLYSKDLVSVSIILVHPRSVG